MVNISFMEGSEEFHISNSRISYIICIMKNRQLGHLYFGKKLRERASFAHMMQFRTKSHTEYLYSDDFLTTMALARQEYPSYGSTDYREPAFVIVHEDGSSISDFRFKSYRVISGSDAIKGLPHIYDESGDDVKTLEVTLEDEIACARLYLKYTIFEKYDSVIRSARFENFGDKKLKLERALSMSLDFYDDKFYMVQLDGAWARERHVHERKLACGIQSISSQKGASSAEHNPFFALKRENTTENSGEAYGFQLIYSGNFLSQVEVDSNNVARAMTGINPFRLEWILDSGESFQTPQAVIAYSDRGLNGVSQIFHHLFNDRLIRGRWRNKERPVVFNNWEGTYFDFTEAKILEMAEKAKELGAELFVLDDGWFGKRDDGASSLGDWYSDLRKLPEGVEGLSRKIKAMGLEFGLWFEPEMVNEDSELYREHPEWAVHTPGRRKSYGRNQLVLDFSNNEVVDCIFDRMSKVISGSDISYIKWDMNRDITESFGLTLKPQNQGEFFHRYILGVYSLFERLIERFPDILFESCASGGARFDAGMLYYAPQCWASDNTDCIERLSIQAGTSMGYPVSSIGAHVSAVPNHQMGRISSLDMRASVAYFGAFGYELNPLDLSSADEEKIREQITFFKKYRSLFQFGTFYRLIDPHENTGYAAWMTVSEDRQTAAVAYYKILANANPGVRKLKLVGLDPDRKYYSEFHDESFYGDELMNFGILPEMEYTGSRVRNALAKWKNSGGDEGDFTSQLFILKSDER